METGGRRESHHAAIKGKRKNIQELTRLSGQSLVEPKGEGRTWVVIKIRMK
jgi:hypothetical protein